ncbi:MAG TPA: hypothetical protein ENI62_14400 [Gammaproteobacteria bacterium]|nr:hypothetical protein [Gammaproteobacteria bacterium]
MLAISTSILIVGGAFIFYQKEISSYQQKIAIEQAHHLKIQTTAIRESLRHAAHSLLFLNQQIRVRQPFTSTVGTKELAEIFIAFLNSNELYDRISLLDKQGKEVLATHYQDDKAVIVPPRELRYLGQRDDFVQTIMLNAKEIYISPMVLATRQGKIIRPLQPIIELGMPVVDRYGKKLGVIILEHLVTNLLSYFKQVTRFGDSGSGYSMLLNQQGYWLVGSDPQDEWGFMFADRKQRRLGIRSPAVWRRISSRLSGHFFLYGGQYRFVTLYPAEIISSVSKLLSYRNPRQSFWKLVSRYPDQEFMAIRNEVRTEVFLPALIILLLMNGSLWILARMMANRKQVEQDLQRLHVQERERASQLEVLGRLSAEIAHELHQPLSAIRSYTDSCLRIVKNTSLQGDKLTRILMKISNQAERAGSVVQQVGNFTRNREMQRCSMNLSRLIYETLNLAELEVRKYRVSIETALLKPSPLVFADRLLIQQVLLNLLRNACESMAGFHPARRKLTISTDLAENSCVKVSVSDQGPGPTIAKLEQIFEPFFSLKKEGMGLGLSVSQSIIRSHEGHIWARKLPNVGFVVCFTLPIIEETDPMVEETDDGN